MQITFFYEEEELKPFKKHHSDAGWDLRSKEEVSVEPLETKKISTGVSCNIPIGCVGIVKIRSSFGAKGLDVTAGVIDSDYRGEIHAVVQNHFSEKITIGKAERFAQIIILPCFLEASFHEGKAAEDTQRGSGGFGSTGKRSMV